jgi:signal peptidase II
VTAPVRVSQHAGASALAWAALLLIAGLGLAVDLVSKRMAFERIADAPVRIDRADVLGLPPERIGSLIPRHDPVVVIPNVLELTLVLNPGAVFGVGPGKRWFFVFFTGVAVGFALWIFARWTLRRDWLSHTAIGLVLAGGIGNLYDRLRFGCVRDFLHPLPGVPMPFGLTWPGGEAQLWPWVSNVADAFLIVGIGLLVLRLWRTGDAGEQQGAAKPSAG